jgi:uncharacterized protein
MPASIENLIAQELSASAQQVVAAIALLDEGATVPFISRYRKRPPAGSTILNCASCRSA